VSGRDLDDVRSMVGLDDLHFAGSHGFDVVGPGGLRMELESASEHLAELDRAERALAARLAPIRGAWVERKRFAIAIHFRESDDANTPRIEQVVDEVREAEPRLRKKGGKKIFELQPDVAWDKGHAVRWLLKRLELEGPDVLPMYIGDDVTDEDAFRALPPHGIGIRLGDPAEPTAARYYLSDTDELGRFLGALLSRLPLPEVNG
jgi:trehalose-phosphatase